jgi:hypothetical protein
MIGGVVDLFVAPSEVLTQYSHVIGTPALNVCIRCIWGGGVSLLMDRWA